MSTSTTIDAGNAASLRKRAVDQHASDKHEHGGPEGSAASSWVPHVHTHSHSHGAEGSAEEADRLLAALKGKGECKRRLRWTTC